MKNAISAEKLNVNLSSTIRGWRIFYALILAVFCTASPAFMKDLTAAGEKQIGQVAGQAGKMDLKEKWGVEVTAIRLTSSDHMIDFRYKVYDPQKAAPLFNKTIKPRLVHTASGKALSVPAPAKVGALRTTEPPQAGRVYWMLFGNGGNLVKKGNEVSVIIGDFRADKLIVE